MKTGQQVEGIVNNWPVVSYPGNLCLRRSPEMDLRPGLALRRPRGRLIFSRSFDSPAHKRRMEGYTNAGGIPWR